MVLFYEFLSIVTSIGPLKRGVASSAKCVLSGSYVAPAAQRVGSPIVIPRRMVGLPC